jgi:hypothetical protein
MMDREEPVIGGSRAGEYLPVPEQSPGYGYPQPSGLPARRGLPYRRLTWVVAAAAVVAPVVFVILMLAR